jgi:hypothetical protein
MFRFAQHDSGIDKSVIQELCGFGALRTALSFPAPVTETLA